MTALSDFLYSTAVSAIWANPKADNNAMFKSNKVTNKYGMMWRVNLPYGNIDLPTTGRRYVLIELGEVPTYAIGINTPMYGWVSIPTIIDTYGTMIQVYSQGRMISPYGSFIQFTDNGNVLLALDFNYNVKTLMLNDDIYVRFYTNVFYVGNAPTVPQKMSTGTYITIANDIINYSNFATAISSLTTSTGSAPLIYKNGLFLPGGVPSYSTLAIGDIIDYISDPFIVAKDTMLMDAMDNYKSTLDGVNKSIFSMDLLDNNIYVDDMECYISGTTVGGSTVGAYFPRIAPSAMRELTYIDIALDSTLLVSRLQELEAFSDVNQALSNVTITLFRRDNQQYKPSLLDSNYIADLTNLPTTIRKQAITGVNANLPMWNATTLEGCPFNTWLGDLKAAISLSALNGVFSRYGAISYYEGVRQIPGHSGWYLPSIAAISPGTLLTYGTDGIGITTGVYSAVGTTPTSYFNGVGYEIFFPGTQGRWSLDSVLNANDPTVVNISTIYDIFCYYLKGSTLTYAILNVDYTLTDNADGTTSINWLGTMQTYQRFIRTTKDIVLFSLTITAANIEAGIDIYGGRSKSYDVGMGTLMMWYNGHFLTEGLDYVVKNGLAYLIAKSQYWTDTATLNVIYAGLPDKSLTHVPNNKWGWVKYGRLFLDNKYDLLAFRNYLFYIDGRAVPLTDIHAKEGYRNIALTTNPLPFVDGTPYNMVPSFQFSRGDILDSLTPSVGAEKVNDAAVSTFLSTLDPQVSPTGVITISKLYQLVSTLMDKVIASILNGTLVITKTSYTKDEVVALIAPYSLQLSIDPCLMNMDPNFTEISPMWSNIAVSMNINQFNFLQSVNGYMLNGLVSGLSSYVTIV